MKSVELFAGAGGLAIGLKRAGFAPEAVLEYNTDACKTLRANPQLIQPELVYEGDVKNYSYAHFDNAINLVSGGPPCQPFSIGGKGKGRNDERDMFPEAVRAIRELAPDAFIFENVKGLLRSSFTEYFEYILLQLEFPLLDRNYFSQWKEHLSALKLHKKQCGDEDLSYDVSFKLFNSANFGVPQKRERVFIVGFRRDLKVEWQFPNETHSQDALLVSKWIDRSYWNRHEIAVPQIDQKLAKSISKLEQKYGFFPPTTKAWVTVRDAIADLPDPIGASDHNYTHHYYKNGARIYPGHTGSYIDEPSKALKAGVHGVPGGENMVRFEDGSVRYFTVRESARIQTFPDSFGFEGSWGEIMRQLGNAVPAKLAEVVGSAVSKELHAVGDKRNKVA